MLYTQIFQELYYQADFNCGGRLPIHVTFMLDEFANVALPDDFCSLFIYNAKQGDFEHNNNSEFCPVKGSVQRYVGDYPVTAIHSFILEATNRVHISMFQSY